MWDIMAWFLRHLEFVYFKLESKWKSEKRILSYLLPGCVFEPLIRIMELREMHHCWSAVLVICPPFSLAFFSQGSVLWKSGHSLLITRRLFFFPKWLSAWWYLQSSCCFIQHDMQNTSLELFSNMWCCIFQLLDSHLAISQLSEIPGWV